MGIIGGITGTLAGTATGGIPPMGIKGVIPIKPVGVPLCVGAVYKSKISLDLWNDFNNLQGKYEETDEGFLK